MSDRRKVVAVVDDELTMLKAIERLLNAHGFATRTFASAEAFLDCDARSEVSCLVLDIHLGGMSGLDLLRRLRNEGSTVPVIIITAFDDARSREQAERLACVAYLRKPCEAETILALLRGLVHDDSSRR